MTAQMCQTAPVGGAKYWSGVAGPLDAPDCANQRDKCLIKVCNKYCHPLVRRSRRSRPNAEAAHNQILDFFMSLTRRLVAQKRHVSLDLIPHLCANIFSLSKLVVCLVLSSPRRAERWLCHDSSWLRQSENPRTAPSSGLPGIRASLLNLHFFLRISEQRVEQLQTEQRALGGSVVRAPPSPKQHARRPKRLGILVNYVAESSQEGKLKIFIRISDAAHWRIQTRVFWVNKKG